MGPSQMGEETITAQANGETHARLQCTHQQTGHEDKDTDTNTDANTNANTDTNTIQLLRLITVKPMPGSNAAISRPDKIMLGLSISKVWLGTPCHSAVYGTGWFDRV